MRFKLSLQVSKTANGKCEIPINYQYPLQCVVYRILSKSDVEFTTHLHDRGYQHKDGGKIFKLFTFSNLIVPNFGIDKERERLIIKSNMVYLYISFQPEKDMQMFIQGIFAQQSFHIFDQLSDAEFIIREVQVMKPLEYTAVDTFRTLSPICISLRNDRGYMDYLRPDHPLYETGILTGLLSRYKVIYGKDFEGEAYCRLNLLEEPKSTLVSIKTGSPKGSRVRGFRYKFQIALPEPLMQIAWESGLGEKGSMGFGMIEKVEPVK